MSSSTSVSNGPSVVTDGNSGQAATQAAWRFFNNERIGLSELVEPLRQAGRAGCLQSESSYVLLAHDWSKLKYESHQSKQDLLQLTHQDDIGYELTSSLLIDASTGNPIAPMQMLLHTADGLYTTSHQEFSADEHRLGQIAPTMEDSRSWGLPSQVVHVIDREANSLGRLRKWDDGGHLFLIRCDDRRVIWNDESWLISEIEEHFNQSFQYKVVKEIEYSGSIVHLEVAEAEIVLHRPHSEVINGVKQAVSGEPLTARLVLSRIVDDENYILQEWSLLTNLTDPAVSDAQVAQWYYYRWRIESFFKLLKSHGQHINSWQQETGLAIARRLLVASMACVQIWNLERDTSEEAEEFKRVLVQLSGRRMKRGIPFTAPALLAGYFNFLAMTQLLEHSNYDIRKLKSLAKATIASIDST